MIQSWWEHLKASPAAPLEWILLLVVSVVFGFGFAAGQAIYARVTTKRS